MIYYKFLKPEPIYYFCEIEYIHKTEQWKDIPDYEGLYQVSDLGRVKSLMFNRCKILKQGIGGGGYLNVGLTLGKKGKTYNVHALMGIVFLNKHKHDLKKVIDHKDNNRLNNKSSNLQTITARHNTSKDRYRKGYSSNYIGVNWSKQMNKWRAEISIDGKVKYLGSFVNEYDAHMTYQKALKELL